MPPRAITSPKKKRSKHKGSDSSKTGLPKRSRAGDIAEVPSTVPLVSLDLTGDAPQRSGRPNVGTGGRCVQLEKIGSVLQSKPRTHGRKGMTSLGPNVPVNPQAPEPHLPPPYSSLYNLDAPAMDIVATGPSFASQQPGGRFGFAAPSTTEIAHSGTTEHNLQASNNPYVADAVAEQHAQNAVPENPVVSSRSVLLEQHIDPALCQQDDTVRAQCRLRLLGSEEEDSDSKGSSSSNDSDDNDDKDANEEDDEEDEEEVENNNTIKSSHEFGWGEVGQCQKEHPGFSEDALPSQLPVTRSLTPEFQFQYLRDEDDMVAQTSLDKTSRNESSQDPPDSLPGPQRQQSQRIEIITSKPNDILQHHHKKNGKPRLPDPESLELLNEVTESSVQLSRNKKSKSSRGGPTPDQLSWYGPRRKSFLEDAKAECHAQHALENPFPTLVKNLLGTITEVLIAVLVVWDMNGKQFEAGVWPEQKFNMTRLSVLKLYDDLSTWRSDLKKTAISIAPSLYLLVPPLLVPVQEHVAWIEQTAAELLKGSLFLQFGVDEQGRTRNFAHPALREAIILFFYTGPYQIAQRMPEIFHTELLLSCLALVAAVFNCVLDSLVKNRHGKSYPNFSTKDYSPVYCRMLKLLKAILEDVYHGPRLSAQLREWAAAGWQGSRLSDKFYTDFHFYRAAAMDLKGNVEVRHDHLQILLN
ncbi:hypothetical protein F4604DRAFT_1919810 [Suillus subluteus]|nr:hypothetical protein F4604DRAFT_1919810 [Suillus subluteus]